MNMTLPLPVNLVQCNRAGEFDFCAGCDHVVPHQKEQPYLDDVMWCTQWEECYVPGMDPAPKVRCVKVKK